MKEQKLETVDGTIYYWISNEWNYDKKTIFFFHGLTANHKMFDEQINYFSKEFNIIVWDAPMHGKSKEYKNFNMDKSVNIILSIIDKLNLKEIIAVGQSFGGYFVQSLIGKYKEKVSLFVSIGSTPYGIDYYSKWDYFWLKQVGWISKCYPYKVLKNMVAEGSTCTDKGENNMIEMLDDYSKNEYVLLMKTYYGAFMDDNKDIDISCPVLITRGEFDNVGNVVSYCESWHENTGYPYVIIEDAGHNANVDNPDEMNNVIENFINEYI
mgnify:FL=1